MKPLVVLLGVFGLSLLILRLSATSRNFNLAGNIAMCCMLCFAAMGHFKFSEGMAMTIPGPVPYKKFLVYTSGLFEVLAGIALLIVAFRYFAGVAIIIFLVLVLPANIYAAVKKVDYKKASFDGKGLNYVVFRIPVQILYIGWVYFFSLSGGN
jgi:uncharacterized membrane protein